jgi:hypothetical protein
MCGNRAFCSRCQQEVELVLYPRGPHVRGDCPFCKQYVKFVEQVDRMPVGKYKGKRFSEIPRFYLRWFVTIGGMERFSVDRKSVILGILGMEERDERIEEDSYAP